MGLWQGKVKDNHRAQTGNNRNTVYCLSVYEKCLVNMKFFFNQAYLSNQVYFDNFEYFVNLVYFTNQVCLTNTAYFASTMPLQTTNLKQ